MPVDHPDELRAWLRLERCEGVGPVTAQALLREFGLPQMLFDAGFDAIARVVGQTLAQRLLASPGEDDRALFERTLAWLADDRHTVLSLADTEYPRQLLELTDPPLLLYVDGDAGLLTRHGVAVVGSRNASTPGLDNARQFARTLAAAGEVVFSGMALGIDAAAHEGALDAGGTTVAVLGTGVDVVYPARHKALAARIAKHGALVSEQPLGMGAIAHNFPKRNRLLSGLARGVLVVEAAAQSGSLITARLAVEQGREVFAIPGSIHSPLSKGCHQLIKQGAKLVDDARDILEEFAAVGSSIAVPVASVRATADVPPWLEAAGYDPFTLDELAARTGAGAAALQATLLDWELDERVARMPGGRWQRRAR